MSEFFITELPEIPESESCYVTIPTLSGNHRTGINMNEYVKMNEGVTVLYAEDLRYIADLLDDLSASKGNKG